MMHSEYEVAIVGLGPVGATLANILGQCGIPTIIFERHPDTYQLPRAVSIDDEAMRIYQSIGLADKISGIVEVGADAHFVDRTGNLLLKWSRPQVITTNGWYVNNRFHQPDFEKELENGLLRFPCVTVLRHREVVSVEQDEYGVTVKYTDLIAGGLEQSRAAFVIGCDGANSLVRNAIGSEFEDLGFNEPWLVVDLALRVDRPDFGPQSIHTCDPERPSSCIFVGGNRRRWEFRLQPGDDPQLMSDPENVWRLLERWISPDEAELERAVVYTFRSQIAKHWRRGRLLVAGDAAHLTPPFMAQGLCAGIRDCANLGWKLNRILKGRAPHDLLETYQNERHPHVRAFIDLTVQMGRLINKTSSSLSSQSASRSDEGPQKLTQIRPVLGPGLAAGLSDWTGQLFPQPRLSTGERLDDRIGLGAAVILRSDFAQRLPAAFGDQAARAGLTVIDDPAPDVQNWFDDKSVNAVAIRPDRYILGAADTLDELDELIRVA